LGLSFKTESLENVCKLVIDCPHSTPKWIDKGFIVIRNSNIRNGRLDLSNPSFTDKENYLYRSRRAEIQENDIVFTREAPMGEVCIIPKGLKACLGQRQVLLRAGKDINPKYLFYALQSPYVQNQVSWNEGTGTTVSNVRIPILKSLKIPRLGSSESFVARTLESIDDKIELNRKMNQTLEEMAQAIFKSWFVDFDPVHTKMACANEEELQQAAKELGISKEILDLFPNEFEESELGMIPRGWRFVLIGDITTVSIGKTPPRKEPKWFSENQLDVKWVSIKDMGDSGIYIQNTSEYLTREAIDKFNVKVIPSDTVILSFKMTVGRVAITTESMCTNEAIAHFRIQNENHLTPEYLYCHLKNFDFRLLGSTSSIVTAVNSKIVRTITTILPTDNVMKLFDNSVKGIFKKIQNIAKEIQTLQKTRDTLLPKLLSGELGVSELEI
jgi:type I restriction enzyme, S subunit